MILAIDPGTTASAFVILDSGKVRDHAKLPNTELIAHLRRRELHADHLAIEMVASYGMPVGAEVFETCLWTGRFIEAWGRDWSTVYRKDVKMFLCGATAGVNDAVIYQRLVDLYGPGRPIAVGTKRNPGPLYGLCADERSALAVALTARHQLSQAQGAA